MKISCRCGNKDHNAYIQFEEFEDAEFSCRSVNLLGQTQIVNVIISKDDARILIQQLSKFIAKKDLAGPGKH